MALNLKLKESNFNQSVDCQMAWIANPKSDFWFNVFPVMEYKI